jgi:hypothetical protein
VTVEKLAVSDGTLSVSGREFAGSHESFTVKNFSKGDDAQVDVWFCPEVKGSGFVSLLLRFDLPEGKLELKYELTGYGSKGKVDWGALPKDLGD